MTDIVEEIARALYAEAQAEALKLHPTSDPLPSFDADDEDSRQFAIRMARACYTIVERRIGELEFQVAQRGMALAPFAEACLNCIDDSEPDNASTWEHPVGMEVTIRDFREARASLEQRSDQ
jgi:hypothetical protein